MELPKKSPVRSYRTEFRGNETPISEGGIWLNGKIGDFTSLKKLVGKEYGVQDGDLIEASVVGNVIKGYVNGKEMISAVDDKIQSGSPGVGFNFFVGNTNVDHGLTFFEVHSYD